MFKVGRLIKMRTIKECRALKYGFVKARIGIKVSAVEFSATHELYSVEETTRGDGLL